MAGHKKNVEDLIGHAMADSSFRNRLLRSPEATLEAEGYEATPELLEAIRSTSQDDINAALESGMGNRRAAM